MSVKSESSSGTAGNGAGPSERAGHPPAPGASNTLAGLASFPDIPRVLPHERVFPIQIGSVLFKMSGASLSSDAPSYFSQFFEKQLADLEDGHNVRTLYIDRDPDTFSDIARHLQGYHIRPRDVSHFVRLFADAQFYSLPRLISQLFGSEIYITIGNQPFTINRDLFSAPGNNPNYFTLGFAMFFTAPSEVFPGVPISHEGLMRPPSIQPPEVPSRSADVFAEILDLLRGYPVHIRSEEHRQQLIRDCKYFHFRGLEQKLIPHEISWNPKRRKHEILLPLEYILRSGVSFSQDPVSSGEVSQGPPSYLSGWIDYSRPFVDDNTPRELIVEISGETTRVDWRAGRATFSGKTNERVSALLAVITNKLGLPVSQEWPMGLNMMREKANGREPGSGGNGPSSPGHTALSEDRVKVRLGSEAYIVLDGEELLERDWMQGMSLEYDDGQMQSSMQDIHLGQQQSFSRPSSAPFSAISDSGRKRKRREIAGDEPGEWLVRKGQWRIRIQTVSGKQGKPVGFECVLVAVKLDAVTGEYGRNAQRRFLS